MEEGELPLSVDVGRGLSGGREGSCRCFFFGGLSGGREGDFFCLGFQQGSPLL
jgi:hypothetical protein